MENTPPLVYISVLNWNGADDTIRCLESLAHLNYPNFKTIVVDNASADDSIQQIQAAFPQLPIIRSAENLGYAGGNRLALEKAIQDHADLFWILNNDTLVEPGTLLALVEAYRQRGPALYGSVTLESGGQRVIRFGGGWKLDANRKPHTIGEYSALRGKPYDTSFQDQQAREVAAVNGSSFMIPISVIKQWGYMDVSFFHGAEESDYCFRLWKKGVPSLLVPASVVVHKGESTKKRSPQITQVITYYRLRNKLEFYRRHGSRIDYLRLIHKQIKLTWRMQILSVVQPSRAKTNLPFYYHAMAVRHAMLRHMGKTLAPEDFLD